MWEATPHSSSYFLTQETFFPNGSVGALSASLGGSSFGIPSLTFGVDGEGRPYSATDGTHSLNLVTATAYNSASSPTSITYGNASTGSDNDVDSFTYDPNSFRPTNLQYAINPTSSPYTVTAALTWNANWSLQKMVYTDGNDSTKNQTCTYPADDLSRIASTSCGTSTWGQTFTYDPFGNIKKTVPSGYLGTAYAAAYSTVTNQVSSGVTASYDKNGNQLTSTPASLTWNALNQPITVNSTTATYDALGRMVEKAVSGTYTQFVYRAGGPGLI
jgi:YD repeat-containing protein